VSTPFVGSARSQKGYPHQANATDFFRPEQRVVENIAAENLKSRNQGHRQANNNQKVLGYAIGPLTETMYPGDRPS